MQTTDTSPMNLIRVSIKPAALALAVSLALGGLVLPAIAPAQVAPAAAPAAVQSPQQIVQQIADQMGAALKGHRREYKQDKSKLVAVINGILLPHFDTTYAALLVLGRYARTATPQQVDEFRQAFYNALIDRYAEGLVNYRQGRVTILPGRPPSDGGRRDIVRTEVNLDDGKKVAVDYVFRRDSEGQWKAFDVVIEGISYIAAYRSQVGEEIRRTSLDALIKRLQSEGGKAIDTMKKQSARG